MDTCPHCGADLPRNARACPECGSDEKTGWSEAAAASGLDLPDEEFSYDEFIEREFGSEKKPPGLRWIWWATALLLLVIALVFFFR